MIMSTTIDTSTNMATVANPDSFTTGAVLTKRFSQYTSRGKGTWSFSSSILLELIPYIASFICYRDVEDTLTTLLNFMEAFQIGVPPRIIIRELKKSRCPTYRHIHDYLVYMKNMDWCEQIIPECFGEVCRVNPDTSTWEYHYHDDSTERRMIPRPSDIVSFDVARCMCKCQSKFFVHYYGNRVPSVYSIHPDDYTRRVDIIDTTIGQYAIGHIAEEYTGDPSQASGEDYTNPEGEDTTEGWDWQTESEDGGWWYDSGDEW